MTDTPPVDPAPQPDPTPPPPAPPAPPAPEYASKAEMQAAQQQLTNVLKTQEGVVAEIKAMREDVTKQLAATRTVNAPQPPPPPQAVEPVEKQKPRLQIREPYGG